ncbi:TIGR03943 family protein [Actinosynnema pretiosum subsp. pretiosum]|uniref:TIGR03943 family protein n=1 Tax=Actinosynnema pretiosum subsp. pretiosum TaxID=103721 RepID=A0AA45LD36_9PSEU|nr:TIGR03943 family protein [Actinosynnema pretiosum subsp. pretiosum]
MRRETQNVLLVLLGGALLKLALTGTYLRYVKASLQPWLVATGVVMVLLAVVAIVRDVRAQHARATSGEPEAHDDHEHGDHEHGGSRSPWLLLLPVLAVFLISPPALGSDSVSRADDGQPQAQSSSGGFAPLADDAVVPLTITEFVTRTAWDDSGSLDDRTVRLTGFVARVDGQVFVARLAISCCAADARPIKVLLTGADMGVWATDQWVEVTGRYVPGTATKETAYVPTFTVREVVPIAAPRETYEG